MGGTRDDRSGRKPRSILRAAVASLIFESLALWWRSGRLGGNVVVRCRDGHLFTTLWIPAASVKSIRLGFWRVQRCPVGHHWTLVSPVKETALTEDERSLARECHDVPLP